MKSRRRSMAEEFVVEHEKEVARLKEAIVLMSDGTMQFWRIDGGKRVDMTEGMIAEDQQIIQRLEDLIAKMHQAIEDGEFD